MSARRRHAALESALREARAPQEAPAQQRAWTVVQAAYSAAEPRRRRRTRAILVLLPAVIVASVLALTPAAATVHHWITKTLTVTHPRRELFSLPAAGRILVSGPGGTWTMAADGSRRRLGAFPDAVWSPHGRYVAVASGDELSALTPNGTPVWTIARPRVRDPRWFGPNGYRVAYLSAAGLRVIAGDGTQDHVLARRVAPLAPAWQPGQPYRLTYVSATGKLVTRDADSGQILWTRRLPDAPELVEWSANGARLLVVTPGSAVVFDGAGRLRARVPAPATTWRSGALSPDGSEIALLDNRSVSLTRVGARAARTVFSGVGARQLAFSPDGSWLLISWPVADQWVFIHAMGAPRLIAGSGITRQLGAAAGFPTLDGWCCTSSGGTG